MVPGLFYLSKSDKNGWIDDENRVYIIYTYENIMQDLNCAKTSIRIHYYTDNRFEKGIQVIDNDGNKFRIYDIEKTVCDIVFYREDVGIEETKEILKNHLGSSTRNLNKLIRYADELKCGDILKTYLEVLV